MFDCNSLENIITNNSNSNSFYARKEIEFCDTKFNIDYSGANKPFDYKNWNKTIVAKDIGRILGDSAIIIRRSKNNTNSDYQSAFDGTNFREIIDNLKFVASFIQTLDDLNENFFLCCNVLFKHLLDTTSQIKLTQYILKSENNSYELIELHVKICVELYIKGSKIPLNKNLKQTIIEDLSKNLKNDLTGNYAKALCKEFSRLKDENQQAIYIDLIASLRERDIWQATFYLYNFRREQKK